MGSSMVGGGGRATGVVAAPAGSSPGGVASGGLAGLWARAIVEKESAQRRAGRVERMSGF
jgi:hypothetical protein